MDGFRGSYFAGSARPRGEFPVGPRAVGGRNTSQRVHHSPLGPRNYLIHTAVSSYSHPIRASEKRLFDYRILPGGYEVLYDSHDPCECTARTGAMSSLFSCAIRSSAGHTASHRSTTSTFSAA